VDTILGNPVLDADIRTTYRATLTAANAQRDAVRAEIAVVTERLDCLKTLDANLSQTVTSLLAILGPDEQKPEVAPAPSGNAAPPPQQKVAESTPEAMPRNGEDEADYGPPLPQPPNLSRRVSSTSSPYRMGIILRDLKHPVTPDEAIAEYVRRDWVEDKWRDPESAMRQALRRTVEYRWARRDARRRVYVTTQTPDGQTIAGDAMDLIGDRS